MNALPIYRAGIDQDRGSSLRVETSSVGNDTHPIEVAFTESMDEVGVLLSLDAAVKLSAELLHACSHFRAERTKAGFQ